MEKTYFLEEDKFKVGDMVKTPTTEGKVVFVSDQNSYKYLVAFHIHYGFDGSKWHPESDLTLIEPERKYKQGDKVRIITDGTVCRFESYETDTIIKLKMSHSGTVMILKITDIEPAPLMYEYGERVWDKIQKCVIGFERYHTNGKTVSVKYGVVTCVYNLSDIEPYTGQDKKETEPAQVYKLGDPVWHKIKKLVYWFGEYTIDRECIIYDPQRKQATVLLSDIEPFANEHAQHYMQEIIYHENQLKKATEIANLATSKDEFFKNVYQEAYIKLLERAIEVEQLINQLLRIQKNMK